VWVLLKSVWNVIGRLGVMATYNHLARLHSSNQIPSCHSATRWTISPECLSKNLHFAIFGVVSAKESLNCLSLMAWS